MTMEQSGSSAEGIRGSVWRVVSGREAILHLQPELRVLAESCGQPGTIDRMQYFLNAPYRGLTEPRSSSLLRRLTGARLPSGRTKVPQMLYRTGSQGLEAAVLLLEYRSLGLRNGLYSPVYGDSDRTVIAPLEQRAAAARQAGELLLRRGARLVLLSYVEEPVRAEPPDLRDSALEDDFWDSAGLAATQLRDTSHVLPLLGTYNETLARMGSRTRRNLRAYQRRAVQQLAAVYESPAKVSVEEFLELNQASFYAAPEWVARWRYASVEDVPGGFFAGLRGGDGRWLSLAGCYVQQATSTMCLDWQMNRTGFESFSLMSALRSFLIADQIQHGRRKINFDGGTSHTIRSAFLPETTRDLLFLHPTLRPGLLRSLSRRFKAAGPILHTLRSDALVWRGLKRAAAQGER